MLDKTSSIICAFGLASAVPRSPYRHLELCGIALNLLPWIWKGLQAGRGSAFVCKSLGNISGFLRLRLAVAWLDDELFWQTNNICFTPDCIWNVHQIAGQQLIERFSLKIPQLVVVRLFFSLQEACSRKKEQALCLSVFCGCSKQLNIRSVPSSRLFTLYRKFWSYTWVSILSQSFGLKDVQEWLGHPDIKMTANIYGHLDTKRKQGIAANTQRPLPAG